MLNTALNLRYNPDRKTEIQHPHIATTCFHAAEINTTNEPIPPPLHRKHQTALTIITSERQNRELNLSVAHERHGEG
jgi:hypothetical protein